MQTLSKAWGLAALRLGMNFSSVEIIEVLNRIKPPYNIGSASQELALKALDHLEDVNEMIKATVEERKKLSSLFQLLPFVQKVYPSDANFLLVKMDDPNSVYEYLKQKGIIVRNRSQVILCEGCLRITVGTPEQDEQLMKALQSYQ
jgi:histidinol-phosphate aminotransferase